MKKGFKCKYFRQGVFIFCFFRLIFLLKRIFFERMPLTKRKRFYHLYIPISLRQSFQWKMKIQNSKWSKSWNLYSSLFFSVLFVFTLVLISNTLLSIFFLSCFIFFFIFDWFIALFLIFYTYCVFIRCIFCQYNSFLIRNINSRTITEINERLFGT